MKPVKKLKNNKLIWLLLTTKDNIDWSSFTVKNNRKVKLRYSMMFKIPRPWSILLISNKKDEEHCVVFKAEEVLKPTVEFIEDKKNRRQFIKTEIVSE